MPGTGFVVEKTEPIVLASAAILGERQLMSPYVWLDKKEGGFHILVRAVPKPGAHDNSTGRIWYGHSSDESGVRFRMDEHPLIVPGPGPEDGLGCEDPTVVPTDEACIVYYTGLDMDWKARMLYASGPNVHALEKSGVVFQSGKTQDNTKEAAVQWTKDGDWRLFYEFSRDNTSLIGLAVGDGPAGGWREYSEPFAPRPGKWDSRHLSPGPLLMDDPERPIMFYNGAAPGPSWRIGWAAFDRGFKNVLERSNEPLLGRPEDAESNGRDIAFAASLVMAGDVIWLYYSVDDRVLRRAILRRV